jgi:hypothetical protein
MLTPKLKSRIIDMYLLLTGDIEFEASRITRYRATIGSYFDITCGPQGDKVRDELTYHTLALGREDGYGYRNCTEEEERIAWSPTYNKFTRELPGTIGHVSFRKTPELLAIVEEIGEDFYILWNTDHFHVEFRR